MHRFRALLPIFLWFFGVVGGLMPTAGAAEPGPARILFLGDAQSLGSFGKTLDRALRSEGLEVFTYAAGGASPYYWLSRYQPITCRVGYWERTEEVEKRLAFSLEVPKIEDLVRRHEPEWLVVQSGLDLYSTLRSPTQPREVNIGWIQELLQAFLQVAAEAELRVFWIGPPDLHEKRVSEELQAELEEILREEVGRYGGTFFSSRAVTEWSIPYPSHSDGMQYGLVEGRQWAEEVVPVFFQTVAEAPTPVSPPAEMNVVAAVPLLAEQASGESSSSELRATVIPREGEKGASEELQVKVILRKKSVLDPDAEEAATSSFGLYEYEVEKVYQGAYGGRILRVAHMLVLNKHKTAPSEFIEGREYYLTLVKREAFPALLRVPTVSQLPEDPDLPVYI
ncbi:MAG: hypothetical protein AAF191_06720, partial [Verrucomicrobiota bacterium]